MNVTATTLRIVRGSNCCSHATQAQRKQTHFITNTVPHARAQTMLTLKNLPESICFSSSVQALTTVRTFSCWCPAPQMSLNIAAYREGFFHVKFTFQFSRLMGVSVTSCSHSIFFSQSTEQRCPGGPCKTVPADASSPWWRIWGSRGWSAGGTRVPLWWFFDRFLHNPRC